jgi:hypothetical protein
VSVAEAVNCSSNHWITNKMTTANVCRCINSINELDEAVGRNVAFMLGKYVVSLWIFEYDLRYN